MKHVKMVMKGIMTGTFIGVLIPLIISLFIGDGIFYYTPFGNDLTKSIINFVAVALFGVYCVYASYIFDIKRLKMIWRYVIHIGVLVGGCLLTGFIVGWFNYAQGFIWALGSFVIIYIVICFFHYWQSRANIKKINDKLDQK